jgi:hypothetical protein
VVVVLLMPEVLLMPVVLLMLAVLLRKMVPLIMMSAVLVVQLGSARNMKKHEKLHQLPVMTIRPQPVIISAKIETLREWFLDRVRVVKHK